MKYNTVLARIQNLTGLIPSQAELCKITGIKQNTMSNRANRDSDFTVGEIDLLNSYYGINIITNETHSEQTVSVDYYPDVFGSCGGGAFVLSERKEKIQVPVKLFKHFSTVKKYLVINAATILFKTIQIVYNPLQLKLNFMFLHVMYKCL